MSLENPQVAAQPQISTSPPSGQTPAKAEDVDLLKWLMIGVVIVLLVGFAAAFISIGGYVVQSEASKQGTYQNLVDKISEQNRKIDNLTEKIQTISNEKITSTSTVRCTP